MALIKLDPASLEFFNGFFESDFSKVRLRSNRWLAALGLAGIALGRFRVFISMGSARAYQSRTPGSIALVGHELCHIAQWRRLGILRFLQCYLGEYIYFRVVCRKNHVAAYRSLSLEEAAFAAERDILKLLAEEGNLLRRLQAGARPELEEFPRNAESTPEAAG